MRVLACCNPLLGHLHPMLPLAAALQDDGHEVVFMTGAGIKAALDDQGFRLLPAGPDFATLVGDALTRHPETTFDTPDDQQRFGFQRLFSEVRVEQSIDVSMAQARLFAPDFILNEVADFVGPLVAAQLDIPNVTLGIGLVLRDEWLRLAADGVAPSWQAAGLLSRSDAGLYRSLYLNQLPRSLQRPSLTEVPSVHDLRPVAFGTDQPLPADLEALGRERPLVYVTFGTVFGDPAPMRAIVDGLADLDIDVLVTVGAEVEPAAVARRVGNVLVRSFVPQGALLGRCRLVVTHGGVGSVVGPLCFGVPLVVVPIGADQEENADQVVRAGVGCVVLPDALSPEVIRDAVVELLADMPAAQAAADMRAEIARMPSPGDVAGLIA